MSGSTGRPGAGLVGARLRRADDLGDATVFEYRVGADGTAGLTVGDQGQAVSDVELSYVDNDVIEIVDVGMGPFPEGEGRVFTPADGLDFVRALLVRFSRNNGYAWMEPITE